MTGLPIMIESSRFLLGLVLCLGLSQTPGAQKKTTPVTIENQSFDEATGTVTFELVNNANSALTAFTYEVRCINTEGNPAMCGGRGEDRAGIIPLIEAVASVGLSTSVPAEMRPIPPAGRQTFHEEIGAGSTAPAVVVLVALFEDGTSSGSAEAVQEFKRERVKNVERMRGYLAALRVADQAAERADVLAALDAEAEARPAVRDEIRDIRVGLWQMPGDIHKNLRDVITVTEAQLASVAQDH